MSKESIVSTSHIHLGTLWRRALRLRCPRCGGGRLFRGMFRMYDGCPNCGLRYERAPGYFLGSAYINYGLTAIVITIAYVGLHFGAGYENRVVLWPFAAFVVVFPLFFFRYARAFWLATDLWFDAEDNSRP
ncbi:MAG: DUF983 domain-containing protein [Planctomycetales bacterium]